MTHHTDRPCCIDTDGGNIRSINLCRINKRPRYIYLAGPIDNATGSSAVYTDQFMQLLLGRGIGAFRPWLAHVANRLSSAVSPYIRSINDQAIRISDLIFIVLPKSIVSVGTVREIEFAMGCGVSCIVATDLSITNYLYDVPVIRDDDIICAASKAIDYVVSLPV